MTENIKRLLELVSKDENVEKSFEEVCKLEGDEANRAVIKLAGEHGITLTDDDFVPDEPHSGEISDDEIEAVAGGKMCVCVAGGGGESDRKSEETCVCVLAGFGKGRHGSKLPGYMRCTCAITGQGDVGLSDKDYDKM